MLNLMGVLNATAAANVSCTCNCKRYTSLQSMEITQLEFVQILVIVVVMMVMVVVITCLLNHYRLSARSILSRHAPARRRHLPLANEGSLWSSEATGTNSGLHEVKGASVPGPSAVPALPAHVRPESLPATYPYLPQSLIDLPPTICLSDGEEPPPYQGPSPPNRTVFDSHPIDPSSSCLQPGSRVDGAPPTYSEVIGHYYHPTSLTPGHHHRTVSSTQPPPSSFMHGLLRPPLSGEEVDLEKDKNRTHNQKSFLSLVLFTVSAFLFFSNLI
uniref:Prostate transmembrane protein, androgen induced 1 n=1 Tax=Labrus bergylta TaxID=56723 RepID=A0A3Q3LLX1_9LABR